MSAPVRVLVIDDNEDVRTVIQLALQAEGFDVSVAENGRQGASMLHACGAQVVVTDILMPEQDGVETIAQLQSQFPQVKIIAISGASSATGFDYLAVPSHLGVRILRKPFEMGELIDLVRELS